jgi:pimeloyl-ACP methyl ester carboxylesterase
VKYQVPPPPAVPLYLQAGGDPIFGVLHAPASGLADTTGVLIVSPFGWEDICSYRSRRDWAEQLASAGHPTLRIDLPSTGDSGGSPSDPGRLSAWSAAASTAAEQLRLLSGCERVAAIGIGLGGLVICRAISENAAIDEVVLWAVRARGRPFLRELRVFARLEDSDFDAPGEVQPQPLPDGYTGAGGFVLSADTTRALEDLDVSTLALPSGRVARALLLERDGIAVDERLRESFERAGAAVTVAAGPGYGAMMAKPHLARPPIAVFAAVQSWLRESRPNTAPPAPSESPADTQRPDGHPPSIDLTVGDVRIRETLLTVEQSFGGLFGVLTEPVDARSAGLCVVMLNAGAIRRVGPNRMWVEAARRWAARGVPTLRLDLEGIGDADGDASRLDELAELYVPELVDQVRAALDALEARGLGSRYVLAGLCSGAYWSFHGALEDWRVAGAFMLNPRALFWNPSLAISRDFRRGLLRLSSWRRVLRREVPLARMFTLAVRAPLVLPRRALTRWYARRRGRDELDRALDRLLDSDKHLYFFFSGNEPLYEELELEGRLEQLDRRANVGLELIPDRDHTLRPFQAQRAAHQALDRALDEELRRVHADGAGETTVPVTLERS